MHGFRELILLLQYCVRKREASAVVIWTRHACQHCKVYQGIGATQRQGETTGAPSGWQPCGLGKCWICQKHQAKERAQHTFGRHCCVVTRSFYSVSNHGGTGRRGMSSSYLHFCNRAVCALDDRNNCKWKWLGSNCSSNATILIRRVNLSEC